MGDKEVWKISIFLKRSPQREGHLGPKKSRNILGIKRGGHCYLTFVGEMWVEDRRGIGEVGGHFGPEGIGGP